MPDSLQKKHYEVNNSLPGSCKVLLLGFHAHFYGT